MPEPRDGHLVFTPLVWRGPVARRRSDRELPFPSVLVHEPGDPALKGVEEDQQEKEADQEISRHASQESTGRQEKAKPRTGAGTRQARRPDLRREDLALELMGERYCWMFGDRMPPGG